MKIETIDDPQDPRLESYRGVKEPRWLRERKIFLAEGRRLVRALLAAPAFRTRSILSTEPALAGLARAPEAEEDEVPVYLVTAELMSRVSGIRFHQGCVAVGELRSAAARSADELIGALAPGPSRIVVLEAVSDPDNVGSIFRSTHAFGVDAVLLGAGCANPLYRKALRTSMGAALSIPFAELLPWPEALEPLRRAGFLLLGFTPHPGATDLAEVGERRPSPERVALVLGGEGFGLSEAVLARVDERVRIPMTAGADSLNVATAAAIAMYHFFQNPGS